MAHRCWYSSSSIAVIWHSVMYLLIVLSVFSLQKLQRSHRPMPVKQKVR